ncbi:MAG: acyl-CoA dehydrogenase family protein [Bacteroidaceae bacterium]|nr:acyl-CoA dehydrogenase family protein [Bacteroidaceae bacterium]
MNWYNESPEIKLRLQHPLMQRVAELKERNYADADKFDYAPTDFADAMDNYDKVLEIVGDICENTIAPNSEGVDKTGPKCQDGRVTYAPGTAQNLQICNQAGLSAVEMPRRLGGLNLPVTVFCAISEMVSRADAGFQNVWGLQSCAGTIYEFGTEEQRQKFIPRICAGQTMSMDLTEPDAGSDLQNVMLKATFDEQENCWRLNGVKRFITNGDSDIHLVLARSEEGTHDGRGLSMFIYDKRDGGVNVRRIEDKMGIHGSPTCELVFSNAKAELCGSRKLGLIKYVMSLMNSARLGIATQSVGISDAAWHEALSYAQERQQFGKPIIQMPAVSEMISRIKAKLEANRSLLYETAVSVDIYKALEDIARERTLTPEERQECKRYSRIADALTPLSKGMSSEYANQNAYDCIQVHGGSGFMRDYLCERLYRDARITSIYEGTTQLQVVAAIRYVTTHVYTQLVQDILQQPVADELSAFVPRINAMTELLEKSIELVSEAKDQEYLDFHARRLVEMAANSVMSALLLRDASRNPELLRNSLSIYVDYAEAETIRNSAFIEKSSVEAAKAYSC